MMRTEVSNGDHAHVFSDGVRRKRKKKEKKTLFPSRNKYVLSIYTVKVKVKFTLEQATKTQRGIRGIAPLF